MEHGFEQLTDELRRWDSRRRLRDGLVWLPRAVLAGLLLAAMVAAAARLQPLLTNREVATITLALTTAALFIGIVVLLWRRHDLTHRARFADRQFRLQERTSTAVELHHNAITAPSAFVDKQLGDTLTAVSTVNTAAALPLRLLWQDWAMVAVAIGLLAAAIILPNPQTDILLQNRTIQKTIEEQISSLEALTEEIQENPDLTDTQKDEILEPVETALEGLGEGGLSQEGAVAVLSEAEADLRELGNDNSTDSLREQLESAGQPLADNENSQPLGEALQDGDLSSAAIEAAQLADELADMSAEDLAQLAQDLAEAAAALEGVDSDLAQQLAEASQALQNGDIEAAQQALREAAGTLQERSQETAVSEAAQNAAGQLGESRNDIAQSTQPGQPNSDGQPGQGEGQQPGQGEGEGQGQGEGEGEGQGEGQGNGQGQGSEQGEGQGSGQNGLGEGGGHAENVFVPDYADLSGVDGVDLELEANCLANPADCGSLLNETPTEFTNENSLVPYNQVFGDYRNAAYEALSDDYIPLGMKGYVRDYFSSLEP